MAASSLAFLCFAVCLSFATAARRLSNCPKVKPVTNPEWLSLTYDVTTVPVEVYAINSAATIVGNNGKVSYVAAKPYLKTRVVQYRGFEATYAAGINSKGVVVGSVQPSLSSLYFYAFINNGSYSKNASYSMYSHPKAPPPPKTPAFYLTGTVFTAINDKNTVVGFYSDSTGSTYYGFSFSLKTGAWTPLVPADSVSVQPWGINNKGDITGSVTCSSGVTYGFLYSKRVFSYFTLHAATNTEPYGINDNGYIVGTYDPPNENFMTTFVAANVTSSSPKVFIFEVYNAITGTTVISDINDGGYIVGSFTPTSPPINYGFVGVPISG